MIYKTFFFVFIFSAFILQAVDDPETMSLSPQLIAPNLSSLEEGSSDQELEEKKPTCLEICVERFVGCVESLNNTWCFKACEKNCTVRIDACCNNSYFQKTVQGSLGVVALFYLGVVSYRIWAD